MAEQDDNKDIVERRLLDAASLLTALIGIKVMAAPDSPTERPPEQQASEKSAKR